MAIFVVPTIRQEDFAAFKEMVLTLPPTFREWTAFERREIRIAQDAGDVRELVSVEPLQFMEYLAERHERPTLPQIYKFAAFKLAGGK